MNSRVRLLSLGALALLLLALPGGGFAASPNANPFLGPVSGPSVKIPGGPAVAPAFVPGTSEGAVGTADAFAYGSVGGTTVISTFVDPVTYEYNSASSNPILAALGLPAGATLWQIDVYGYTSGVSSQSWELFTQDSSTGQGGGAVPITTSSAAGIVHGVASFTSGLTLAEGQQWVVDLFSTSAASGYVGAIFQYTLPTLSFVPITPARVLDTRNGTGGLSGPFTNHVARTFQVTGSGGVPAGAKAVTGNLTVTGQTSSGYLFIGPVATNNPTSSTLNFPAGDDRANAVTVGLSATGTLSITFVAPSNGPTAQAVFDVTGYYR